MLKDTNFRIIIGILVMAVMGGSIIGPILPVLANALGVSDSDIGWVLSIYTLFALVFTPILGVAADRLGRKTVLVPTTIIYGIAGISISLCSCFWLVLLLRAIQGICVAGMMNLAVTLIGDLYEGKRRSIAMGYRTSAQNFTNTIMPFLSGAVATVGWFYPFFIYGLSIPVGLLTIFKLNVKEESKKESFNEYLKAAAFVMRKHTTMWLFFSNFMLFFSLYCIVVYMPLMITKDLGFSTVYSGIAISIAAGTSGFLSPHTGKLKGIFKVEKIVTAGFALSAISLFLISISTTLVQLFASLFVWGCGFALIMPIITTHATEQAPIHLRAGVMAVFSMMIYLGQTISPPFFGAILEASTLQNVFMAGALIGIIPIAYSMVESVIRK